MTLKTQKPIYQNFIISDVSSTDPWQLAKHWLRIKARRPARPFCGTSIRRVGKGKIEVTFELPLPVRQQMHQAIKAGRPIRFYAP